MKIIQKAIDEATAELKVEKDKEIDRLKELSKCTCMLQMIFVRLLK